MSDGVLFPVHGPKEVFLTKIVFSFSQNLKSNAEVILAII
jgi:hypothetical protein